jgi:hypothetical protein
MCWHPLARKLQRSKKMSDTPTPQEAAESGLPDTPCSRSYFETLDTGRKRRVFLDDESLESMYQNVVAACLRCDPIPASKRKDGQLEPPWKVIDRILDERNTARVVAADAIRELDRILDTGDTYASREIVQNLKDFLRGDSSENVTVEGPAGSATSPKPTNSPL